MPASNPQIVICGAGVIGAAVAYYLTQRGMAATVVERTGIACAASGKAGGFLALDWCDGTSLQALARISFALHAQLARTLDADYGYRRLTTLAVAASEKPGRRLRPSTASSDWLGENCVVYAQLGNTSSTAQVHPECFTRALLKSASAKLIYGRVSGIEITDGQVRGVRVDDTILPADIVVLALGPWSKLAGLALPPVHGLKGHSITLRPDQEIPAQALFMEYESADGSRLSPEVYPRPDGEVYLSGLSDESPVPDDPGTIKPRADAATVLLGVASALSPSLSGLQVERVQACYRPICQDGLPLLGAIAGVAGAYIATGHSCWGILNAPASGLALAELIAEGSCQTLDLSPFDPRRLNTA